MVWPTLGSRTAKEQEQAYPGLTVQKRRLVKEKIDK